MPVRCVAKRLLDLSRRCLIDAFVVTLFVALLALPELTGVGRVSADLLGGIRFLETD